MTATDDNAIGQRLELAIRAAHDAGALTLQRFRNPRLEVERKEDDSPVTLADREAEQLLRQVIAGAFPDDAILGEEFGETPGESGFQWVLDPIDGTKSFIHGVPLYTTLVAVLEGDVSHLGVIHSPATDETVYAARGSGCWYRNGSLEQEPRPAQVSQTARLSEALVLTSEVKSFATGRDPGAIDVFLQLQEEARLMRTWGDAYGYLMVATGRAEVMIDPEMNLWDAAALQPIVEEAGGQFSDWQGVSTVHSGEAVATNGLVADEVLALTRGR